MDWLKNIRYHTSLDTSSNTNNPMTTTMYYNAPQPLAIVPIAKHSHHIIKEILDTEKSYARNIEMHGTLLQNLARSRIFNFKAGLTAKVMMVVELYAHMHAAHQALADELDRYVDVNRHALVHFFTDFIKLAMPIYQDDIEKTKMILKDIMGADIGLVSTVYKPDPFGYIAQIEQSPPYRKIVEDTMELKSPTSVDILIPQRMLKFPLFMNEFLKHDRAMIIPKAVQDRLLDYLASFNAEFNDFMEAWLCQNIKRTCQTPGACLNVKCGEPVIGSKCCVCQAAPKHRGRAAAR